MAGKPPVKDTRISLDGGRSKADITRRYSHITPEDIRFFSEQEVNIHV